MPLCDESSSTATTSSVALKYHISSVFYVQKFNGVGDSYVLGILGTMYYFSVLVQNKLGDQGSLLSQKLFDVEAI